MVGVFITGVVAEYRMRSGMEAAAANGWAVSKALQDHTQGQGSRVATRAAGR